MSILLFAVNTNIFSSTMTDDQILGLGVQKPVKYLSHSFTLNCQVCLVIPQAVRQCNHRYQVSSSCSLYPVCLSCHLLRGDSKGSFFFPCLQSSMFFCFSPDILGLVSSAKPLLRGLQCFQAFCMCLFSCISHSDGLFLFSVTTLTRFYSCQPSVSSNDGIFRSHWRAQ